MYGNIRSMNVNCDKMKVFYGDRHDNVMKTYKWGRYGDISRDKFDNSNIPVYPNIHSIVLI